MKVLEWHSLRPDKLRETCGQRAPGRFRSPACFAGCFSPHLTTPPNHLSPPRCTGLSSRPRSRRRGPGTEPRHTFWRASMCRTGRDGQAGQAPPTSTSPPGSCHRNSRRFSAARHRWERARQPYGWGYWVHKCQLERRFATPAPFSARMLQSRPEVIGCMLVEMPGSEVGQEWFFARA